MNVLEARRRLLGRNVYKKTVEGNPAIAQGSLARWYPGITMQGWTEQPQYEGKNLLDNLSSEWNIGVGLSWGSIYDTTIFVDDMQKYRAHIIINEIKPNTKYSFKNLNKEKIWVDRIIVASDYGNGLTNISLYVNVETQNRDEYTFTTINDEKVKCVYFQVRTLPSEDGLNVPITEENIKNMKVCFNEGDPIYEPYTGGAPSPSPDYPQEITSAGKYNEGTGKYEYEIEVTGANLLDAKKYVELNSRFYEIGPNGGVIQIASDGRETGSVPVAHTLPPGTFYIRGDKTNAQVIIDGVTFSTSAPGGYVILTLEKETDIAYKFYGPSGTSYPSEEYFPMVSRVQDATYEPYRTPQTVALTADRPLTKWDKLTKKNGVWGWEYGSAEIVFDGSDDENWFDSAINDGYYTPIATSVHNDVSVEGYAFSDKFLFVNIFTREHPSIISPSRYYYFLNVKRYGETLSDWRTYLQTNPVTILYETELETFVPLSAPEQEQMNALYTFRPTTVLSNDAGCEMSLTYKTRKSMEVTT